jgi:glyoxylase-like metal-dependent hydrolase (beta-lactamase superfamily II)
VGWTTTERDSNRALTFPNARHLVSRVEWDTWYGHDDPVGPHPKLVQKPLDGRIQWLEDGDAVADGVHVLSTPGHSPGHMSCGRLARGTAPDHPGDLIHSPVQLAEPTWHIAFDADPDLAAASRERVLHDLEHPDSTAAVGHFADNVFGQVVWEDGARRWRPF